jgi:HEAT repeat protein
MLRVVTEEFASDDEGEREQQSNAPMTMTLSVGSDEELERTRAPRRLERAWTELGALRADRPEHLDRILAAARDGEPARRQVAAALLADAAPEVAERAWDRLLRDSIRSVRRSTVDAIADVGREDLRPLLEQALTDSDAWVRWKALHGIADIGIGSSRPPVETCAGDPDFRVRLEAARVLAGAERR